MCHNPQIPIPLVQLEIEPSLAVTRWFAHLVLQIKFHSAYNLIRCTPGPYLSFSTTYFNFLLHMPPISQIRGWCDHCSLLQINETVELFKYEQRAKGINIVGLSKLFTHVPMLTNWKQEEVCAYAAQFKGIATDFTHQDQWTNHATQSLKQTCIMSLMALEGALSSLRKSL